MSCFFELYIAMALVFSWNDLFQCLIVIFNSQQMLRDTLHNLFRLIVSFNGKCWMKKKAIDHHLWAVELLWSVGNGQIEQFGKLTWTNFISSYSWLSSRLVQMCAMPSDSLWSAKLWPSCGTIPGFGAWNRTSIIAFKRDGKKADYPIQPHPNDFLPGVSPPTFCLFDGTISKN